MTSSLLRAVAATAALGLLPAAALAQDVPDITGKWVGKTFSIVAGQGGHWPSSAGTFEKPGLFEKDLTVEVTGQEGGRFWGVVTLAGDGESTDEPFIGVFVPGSGRVVVADTDGYWNGTIKDGTLSFCYAHAGGRSQSTVVSCTEIRHEP